MPIRPEARARYPANWLAISQEVRFKRARGRCEHCRRPHGQWVRALPDGRWFDAEAGLWRDDQGRDAPWPDIVDYTRARIWRVVLAAAHLDGDPSNASRNNLRALCQRCHLAWDRPLHRLQTRMTILLRRTLGDLLEGPYRRDAALAAFAAGARPGGPAVEHAPDRVRRP